MPRSIRVSSNDLIYSPGLWKIFETARITEPHQWCVDFLKMLTCDRITDPEIAILMEGKGTVSTEGETLIITIPTSQEINCPA